MGSWNGTCGLTQLAIGAGTPIRLVFIAESCEDKNLAGFCHSTDLYYPFAIPIKGEYNDYGGIENIKSSLNQGYIESFLKETAVHIPNNPKRDKYVDRNSFDKEQISMEYILERAQEGALSIHDPVASSMASYRYNIRVENAAAIGEPVPPVPDYEQEGRAKVGYIMIREDMYQAILNATISDQWNGGKKIRLKDYMAGADKYLEGLKNFAKEEAELKKLKKTDSWKLLNNILGEGYLPGKDNDVFAISLSRFNSALNDKPICKYDEFIKNKLRGGMLPTSKKIKQLVYELAEFFYFRTCFSNLRKSWVPQSGAGSQDDELNLHLYLAKAVSKYTEDEITRMKVENAEWDLEKAIDNAGKVDDE